MVCMRRFFSELLFDCFMLCSQSSNCMQKTKLYGYYLGFSFNVSWGLGKTFLTRAVLNILHFSRDLVFKEWSYAMIRLGIPKRCVLTCNLLTEPEPIAIA